MPGSEGKSSESTSPHHVGRCKDVNIQGLYELFREYADRQISQSSAFDFGKYNGINRSQTVKPADLLKIINFIHAILGFQPSLRLKQTQVRDALLLLNDFKSGQCNASDRSNRDWARATSLTISVVLAHSRRLKNEKLYLAADARLASRAEKRLLETLRRQIIDETELLDLSADVDEESDGKKAKTQRTGTTSSKTAAAKKKDDEIKMKTDEKGWPIDPDSADELEGKMVFMTPVIQRDEKGWAIDPDSDDEVPPVARRSAAPSTLSAAEMTTVREGLKKRTSTSLPSGALRDLASSHRADLEENAELGTGAKASLSIGTIKLGCYSHKSYIQCYSEDEAKWKSVCYCDKGKSVNHHAIMKKVFQAAQEHDWDEDLMRRARDDFLEDE